MQYVLGEWDFQGLSLKMVPPVFIPRPETEVSTSLGEGGDEKKVQGICLAPDFLQGALGPHGCHSQHLSQIRLSCWLGWRRTLLAPSR